MYWRYGDLFVVYIVYFFFHGFVAFFVGFFIISFSFQSDDDEEGVEDDEHENVWEGEDYGIGNPYQSQESSNILPVGVTPSQESRSSSTLLS